MDRPLNSIGMPYYDTPLLSNLPSSTYCPSSSSPFFNPHGPVPPSVLSSVRQVDFVGYAQTPRELKGTRHRVAGPLKKKGKSRRVSEPRFRSERERSGGGKEKLEVTVEDDIAKALNKYRKVEIKYSKFGAFSLLFSPNSRRLLTTCLSHLHARSLWACRY